MNRGQQISHPSSVAQAVDSFAIAHQGQITENARIAHTVVDRTTELVTESDPRIAELQDRLAELRARLAQLQSQATELQAELHLIQVIKRAVLRWCSNPSYGFSNSVRLKVRH
jgi:hypothetical protein